MKLSILICSLNERQQFLNKLLSFLASQSTSDIEIIVDADDGSKLIGRKRNDLLRKAQGEYIVFIDDDDWVADDYCESILKAIENKPDCVGFYGEKWQNDSLLHRFKNTMHVVNEPSVEIIPIMHTNPVKRELALTTEFAPYLTFCEDQFYALNLRNLLRSEVCIEKNMYFYHYRPYISASVKKEIACGKIGLEKWGKKDTNEVTGVMFADYNSLSTMVLSVANQNLPIRELIIFDNNTERMDLKNNVLFNTVTTMLTKQKIQWKVLYPPATLNKLCCLQNALENTTDPWMWVIEGLVDSFALGSMLGIAKKQSGLFFDENQFLFRTAAAQAGFKDSISLFYKEIEQRGWLTHQVNFGYPVR